MFGLVGFVLPEEAVRGFGTWFFQRMCELLAFEIERSGEHPALWEKKGVSLYTLSDAGTNGLPGRRDKFMCSCIRIMRNRTMDDAAASPVRNRLPSSAS